MRLLPLLLLACTGTGTKTDDTAGGDADTDTDADTDADVDLGPCPAYSGYAEGRTWEWSYNDDAAEELGAGHWTTTVSSLGADGVFELRMDATFEVEGFDSYVSSTVMSGSCDTDGAWLNQSDSTTTYVLGGRESTVTSSTIYDPPYLTLPTGLEVGATWTATVAGTTETDTSTTPFSYELEGEAVGAASIEVPAGTFDTLEIRTTTEYGASSMWADRVVGPVATEQAELLSY